MSGRLDVVRGGDFGVGPGQDGWGFALVCLVLSGFDGGGEDFFI